jgi:hypothetical protein
MKSQRKGYVTKGDFINLAAMPIKEKNGKYYEVSKSKITIYINRLV